MILRTLAGFTLGTLACASSLDAWAAAHPETPLQALASLADARGFDTRLEAASRLFLGRAYSSSPTGDGPGSELDERLPYDFKNFDCVTFVDTVWALSVASSPEEFDHQLDRIRYADGKRSFLNRYHHPDADWTRGNERTGILEDITAQVATPLQVDRAEFKLDRAAFFRAIRPTSLHLGGLPEDERRERLRRLRASTSKILTETAAIPYIRMEDVLPRRAISTAQAAADRQELELKKSETTDLGPRGRKLALGRVKARQWRRDLTVNLDLVRRIPNGAVLQIVKPHADRRATIGTPVNITHRGLLFWRKGTLYLRHASNDRHVVFEEPLIQHLKWILGDPELGGINLLQWRRIEP